MGLIRLLGFPVIWLPLLNKIPGKSVFTGDGIYLTLNLV